MLHRYVRTNRIAEATLGAVQSEKSSSGMAGASRRRLGRQANLMRALGRGRSGRRERDIYGTFKCLRREAPGRTGCNIQERIPAEGVTAVIGYCTEAALLSHASHLTYASQLVP